MSGDNDCIHCIEFGINDPVTKYMHKTDISPLMIQAVVSIALYRLNPAACIFLPLTTIGYKTIPTCIGFGRIQSALENILDSRRHCVLGNDPTF